MTRTSLSVYGPRWSNIVGTIKVLASGWDINVIEYAETKGLFRKVVLFLVEGEDGDLDGFEKAVRKFIDDNN